MIVIGIGNPLLCDDTAGLHTVDRLEKECSDLYPDVQFKRLYSGGMELLDDLVGHTHALIIDCIIHPNIPNGAAREVLWEEIEHVAQERLASAHGLNLPTVVSLGRKCGLSMPNEISIVAIGGSDFTTFSEMATSEVQKGIEIAVVLAKKKIYNWMNVSKVE